MLYADDKNRVGINTLLYADDKNKVGINPTIYPFTGNKVGINSANHMAPASGNTNKYLNIKKIKSAL